MNLSRKMLLWATIMVIQLSYLIVAQGTLFRNCCYYVAIRNCSGNMETSHLCPDCTTPTPYCGVGKCNIFGCNCDGCKIQAPGTQILGHAKWFNEHI